MRQGPRDAPRDDEAREQHKVGASATGWYANLCAERLSHRLAYQPVAPSIEALSSVRRDHFGRATFVLSSFVSLASALEWDRTMLPGKSSDSHDRRLTAVPLGAVPAISRITQA
jgi:hypothetical protein